MPADRVELGSKARVLGNVHYTVIETAVGAQINGKLIHRELRRGTRKEQPGLNRERLALIGRGAPSRL